MTTLTVAGLVDYGLSLTGATTITSTGTVESAGSAAVSQGAGTAILSNAGQIDGDVFGVSLLSDGTITNLVGGTISGVDGIDVLGRGVLDNFGTIRGVEIGIIVVTAAVTNEVSGEISGGALFGSGELTNMGTIAAPTGDIVSFSNGGTVLNLGATAHLTGGDVLGVVIDGGLGVVLNQGSISGVSLAAGGSLTNSGYINTGMGSVGVAISAAPAYVNNTGEIIGAQLNNGGHIANGAAGTITGYVDGIDLAAGGNVTNSGKILGIGARLSSVETGRDGISLSGAGTIVNNSNGLIQGSNDGILLTGTGEGAVTVTNYGTIIGKKGISVTSTLATTIVDYGTITGTAGTAIAFEDGNDVLVMESGAVVNGIVVGGYGANDVSLWLDGTVAQGTSIEVESGGNLILTSGMPAGQTISFAGTDATLMISDAPHFRSAITGMESGDTIDLSGVSYDRFDAILLTSNNVLELIGDGTTSLQLDPTQNFANEFFHISSDGLNGTDVTESTVPCFLADTRIATTSGDVAVQDLRIGDLVRTADGTARPVKWIGHRFYKAPLPNDPDVIPVRIRAGALAPGVPKTDLYLSPRHAVRVEGVLVPAGALINGVSVLSCPDIQSLKYYHIEMESHDLVIANGAEAETFIDHDSRKMFDNAEEYYQLYPRGWATEMVLCAPRLEFGSELDAVRRKVAFAAGLLLDQPADSPVVGFLEQADRQNISGWAYAPSQPNVPVRLDIFNRGALLARTVANIPRPDVKRAGFGHGRCGFHITLPAPLPALMRHEISVRPVGQQAGLTGSPAVIDPAIAHDLLKTGGLKSLIEAAVQGLGTQTEVVQLATTLEAAGRNIRLTVEAPPQPRPLPGRVKAAGDGVVLVINGGWPTVTRDAGSNAVISHVEAFMALGYTVEFCATGGPPANADEANGLSQLLQRGVRCHGHEGTTTENTIRALAARRLDCVYLHRLDAASAYGGLVRQHAPTARIVYAVADLHHLRLARHAAVAERPDLALKARSVRAAELWAMQLADCVITHSRYEAAYLQQAAPGANVVLVPWAVKLSPQLGAGRNRQDIAFIGGAGHAPNVDALTHLARDIMPIVWQTDPSIRCLVAGAGWPVNMFASFDPRIVNLGHQPELTGLLRAVRLTVAPLRFGAGIKGKVLDSMAAGTPCVMSEVAAEGLALEPALRGIVGDGAAFAANVLAVYRDKKLARVVAQAGRDLVETCFSAEAVLTAMAQVLGRPAPDLAPASTARRLPGVKTSSARELRPAAPARSPQLPPVPGPATRPPRRPRLPDFVV